MASGMHVVYISLPRRFTVVALAECHFVILNINENIFLAYHRALPTQEFSYVVDNVYCGLVNSGPESATELIVVDRGRLRITTVNDLLQRLIVVDLAWLILVDLG